MQQHIRAVVKAEKEAERQAREPTRLVLKKPPPPRNYHYEWLHLAHSILRMSNHYIINPRNIYATSLFEADADWIMDFGNYLSALDFERDYDKRPEMLK